MVKMRTSSVYFLTSGTMIAAHHSLSCFVVDVSSKRFANYLPNNNDASRVCAMKLDVISTVVFVFCLGVGITLAAEAKSLLSAGKAVVAESR